MEPNRSVKDEKGDLLDFIFGPDFLCGCKGEDFDSLSDEQVARYLKMFQAPERLVRYNGELVGLPFNPKAD